MNVQNELRYRLAVDLLEKMAAEGFLNEEELVRAKGLAAEKYRPSIVWEL